MGGWVVEVLEDQWADRQEGGGWDRGLLENVGGWVGGWCGLTAETRAEAATRAKNPSMRVPAVWMKEDLRVVFCCSQPEWVGGGWVGDSNELLLDAMVGRYYMEEETAV